MDNMMKIEDCPEYVAASKKLGELRVRLTELERAMARTEEAVGGGRTIQEQADALLRGVPLDDFDREGGLRRDYDAARRERNILRVAVEKQQVEVGKACRAAGVSIRTKLRPMHEAIAVRMAKALRELHASLAAEHAFREELRTTGVDMGFPLLCIIPTFNQPGEVTALDLLAYIELWFSEVSRDGYRVGKGV
jgi:hypothetical protein